MLHGTIVKIIKTVPWASGKVPVILTKYLTLQFSGKIFENAQISNFMTILLVGADLFRADGQTDI